MTFMKTVPEPGFEKDFDLELDDQEELVRDQKEGSWKGIGRIMRRRAIKPIVP